MLGCSVLPRNVIGAWPFAVSDGGPQRAKIELLISRALLPLTVTSMPGTSSEPRPMMAALRIVKWPVQPAALRIREPLLLLSTARADEVPTHSKLVLPLSTRSLAGPIFGPPLGGSTTVIGTWMLSTSPDAIRLRTNSSYEPAATPVTSTW